MNTYDYIYYSYNNNPQKQLAKIREILQEVIPPGSKIVPSWRTDLHSVTVKLENANGLALNNMYGKLPPKEWDGVVPTFHVLYNYYMGYDLVSQNSDQPV